MAIIYNLSIPAQSESLDLSANPIAGFIPSNNGALGVNCVYRSRVDSVGPYLGFELSSDGTTSTYRTEIGGDSNAGTSLWVNGTAVAVRVRMAVEDFQLSAADEVIVCQIHQIKLAAPTFSPLVAIYLTSTGYVAEVKRSFETPFAGGQRAHRVNLGGFKPGDVEDFVFVLNVQTTPTNGALEIWRNGTKVAALTQPTRLDISGGSSLYAKMGIYASGWSSTGGAVGRFVKTRVYRYVAGDAYADVMAA